MKKFLALILAAMMLLSCTALAEGAVIDVRVKDANYTHDVTTAAPSTDAKTEMWLQVTTTGIPGTGEGDDPIVGAVQIDVTVPLVLVFQTSINGGSAATGTNYGITNNTSVNLAVTKIAVDEDDTDKMDIVNKDTNILKVNEYAAWLEVDTNKVYDLSAENAYSAVASNGGLFQLEAATFTYETDEETGEVTKENKVPTKTDIDANMKTGRLDFVTKSADEDGNEYGVHLLTVNYTVAVDTQVTSDTDEDGEVTGDAEDSSSIGTVITTAQAQN